jgi:hypothetical protein
LSDDLLEIEEARSAIIEEYSHPNGYAEGVIAKMKKKSTALDAEISSLEAEVEEGQKTEDERRVFIQTIKQRLDIRCETAESDLAEARTLIQTRKLECKHLEAELKKVLARAEDLEDLIDREARGIDSKPDFRAILETDKLKLNKSFAKKARKQLIAQKKLEQEQTAITIEINKQRKKNEELVGAVTRCTQESRKRAEFSRKQRKRSKLMGVELRSLESVLSKTELSDDDKEIEFPEPAVIERPRSNVVYPPRIESPKREKRKVNLDEIERLATELEGLHSIFEKGQKEMEALKAEEDGLKEEMEALGMENGQLVRDLARFDEVKTFWEALSARVKPSGSGTRKRG